jgi:hypothetical protein
MAVQSVETIPYDFDRTWCLRWFHGFRVLASSGNNGTHRHQDGDFCSQADPLNEESGH